MAGKKNIFVVPDGKSGWDVKRGGNPNPLSHHHTQRTADEAAKKVATHDKVDRVTLGRDGRIRSKDSFGNESRTKDKEH